MPVSNEAIEAVFKSLRDNGAPLPFSEHMRAALEAASPLMPGWQSMDSAPKNGTFVLCAHASGHINIMQFSRSDDPAGFWRTDAFQRSPSWEPTYWKPLPAAPALPTPPEGWTMTVPQHKEPS